jgi:hypothetical protein
VLAYISNAMDAKSGNIDITKHPNDAVLSGIEYPSKIRAHSELRFSISPTL